MRTARLLVTLFSFVLVTSCTTAPVATVAAPPEPTQLIVVGTTDIHGWIDGHPEQTAEGESFRSGGLDVLGGYLANLRAKYGDAVVVVDSGDMYQGTLAANLSEGEAVIRAMNELGHAAAAVGNHEFDFGPVGPMSQALDPGADPLGAVKRNAEIARFPLLGANIREKATGAIPGWVKPYTIIERGGVKVGIIGVATEDTPEVTLAANVASLVFTDPAEAVREATAAVRRQGADAVIVIAHIGGSCTDLSNPLDTTSCAADSHLFQLARALPAGSVDAIFGGHSHQQVRHVVNGIPIMQAPPLGRGFSTVELWVDTANDEVLQERTVLRPHTPVCEQVFAAGGCNSRVGTGALAPATFEGLPVTPAANVRAAMQPFIDRTEAKRRSPIGVSIPAPVTRNYNEESPLGNLIADALRLSYPEADFAFINSGGIRADLKAGPLTYGDVFEVLPFDNFPTLVQMTGRELQQAMELTLGSSHGTLQISGFKARGTRNADGTVSVELWRADGTPIDLDRTYTVVTLDFVAAGGSGVGPVMAAIPAERKKIFYDRAVRDVFIDALRKMAERGAITPRVEGRLVVPPR